MLAYSNSVSVILQRILQIFHKAQLISVHYIYHKYILPAQNHILGIGTIWRHVSHLCSPKNTHDLTQGLIQCPKPYSRTRLISTTGIENHKKKYFPRGATCHSEDEK